MATATPAQLVAAARAYVGTPFHAHGRRKGAGVDCNGLLFCALWDVGVACPEFLDYDVRLPAPEVLMRELGRRADPVSRDEARAGDVLVLCIRPGRPQHFGMASDRGLIHADWSARRVTEVRLPIYWANRLHAVFRPRHVGPWEASPRLTWPDPQDEVDASYGGAATATATERARLKRGGCCGAPAKDGD